MTGEQGLSAGLSSPAFKHLLCGSPQGHGAGLEELRDPLLLIRNSASLHQHAAELELGEFPVISPAFPAAVLEASATCEFAP